MTNAPTAVCTCAGKGATTYEETDELGTCFGTKLCGCRSALPPRDGKAAWWTTEPVFSATVDIPVGDKQAEIVVTTEVPISEDNYRVQRRGNRYWPTLVDLNVGKERLTLHTDTARMLAQQLIKAADAADAIDIPDTDTCGHWAPCDCGGKATA